MTDSSAPDAGLALGIVQLVCSPIGLFLGAYLSERLARRHDNANLRVIVIAWVIATPLTIASPLMPTPWLSLLCSGLSGVAALMAGPTQNAALQSVTPNRMRGQVTALYLLAYTAAGMGLGPSLVAEVTEHVVGNEAGLRYAMAGIAAVVMPLAVLTMLLGLKAHAVEIARLRRMGDEHGTA